MYEEVEIINIEKFNELKKLLEDDFVDLVKGFIQDSQNRLQEIQKAFDNNDNAYGFDLAHSLKGASMNLGATYLAELCYELQEMCRGKKIHFQQELIHEIKQQLLLVNQKVSQLLNL